MATSSAPPFPEPLDTTVRLTTPERIVFQYPLAGPFRRAFAYAIDVALLIALVIAAVIASLLLSLGSISGIGPALVAYFVIVWGYSAFCEAVFNGQTLGKRLVGHPRRLGPGDSHHRGAGGAAQPGGDDRRADPVLLPARAGEHRS